MHEEEKSEWWQGPH